MECDIKHIVMICVGIMLIYLAIKKQYEPSLLLPMGFGSVLVNLPNSAVINQTLEGIGETNGIIQWMYEAGIECSEAMPILLFIGIGAMIDFGPLLENPKLFLLGIGGQMGIIAAAVLAYFLGFDLKDAACIGIIGAADGPTSIMVSQVLKSDYIGSIAVAAYSYMAIVPMILPFAIRLATTKKERQMIMEYNPKSVSRIKRIAFPICVTIITGVLVPSSLSLVGFLMFGNLIKECEVLKTLTHTAQETLTNMITLLLGITISFSMKAEQFVTVETIMIMGIGLFAFLIDAIGGIMTAKIMNLFSKKKINPIVGAAGISAFPMAARTVQSIGAKENPMNVLLNHGLGANVAGQITSAIAGGIIINLVSK